MSHAANNMSTTKKAASRVGSGELVRLFVVIYDDADCLSVPMAWDEDCTGAICAWGPGQKVATFATRAAAQKAIRISACWARLRIEQGKPANTDFTESRQNLQVAELSLPNTKDEPRPLKTMNTTDRSENQAAPCVGSGALLAVLFGFPIWTEDFDGELRKRRARYIAGGRIITSILYGRIIGNADGTFHPASYVKRWFPRKTIFG
jgi:hypothetical protein